MFKLLVISLTLSVLHGEVTHRYLFMGHPRDDEPGEILQREVERVDYSAYDLLLLGGDYTWRGTGTLETVNYLEEVFTLSSPNTLTVFGNHDTQNKSFLTDITGRPAFYSQVENDVIFVVLDTTDNSRNITGAELTMLEDAVDAITTETHLVIIHHHFIWMADYAPLAHLQGSSLIGASSNNLSNLNFYDDVYPLLLEAQTKGAEVICIGGDRTGSNTAEFFIDHTTTDGIRFIGAGLKEELTPTLRTVVILEHNQVAGTLTPVFKHLSDLPRIPDEPVIISEIHYNPAPAQGNDFSFIEFYNRGDEVYDLSLATFSMGVTSTIPDGTTIAPGEYIIVASHPPNYSGLNAQVINYSGTGRPEDGEPIILRNALGLIIDAVDYESSGDWPTSPDNTGPSLMLIDNELDNSLPAYWVPSDQDGGTPGARNFEIPEPAQVSFVNGEAQMTWSGVVSGATYVVEYSETLDSNWQQLGLPVTPSGSTLMTSDPAPSEAKKFYRLGRVF